MQQKFNSLLVLLLTTSAAHAGNTLSGVLNPTKRAPGVTTEMRASQYQNFIQDVTPAVLYEAGIITAPVCPPSQADIKRAIAEMTEDPTMAIEFSDGHQYRTHLLGALLILSMKKKSTDLDNLKKLIDADQKGVNIKNTAGTTLLMMAANSRNDQALALLLQHCTPELINAVDATNLSALDYAEASCKKCVELLKAKGAGRTTSPEQKNLIEIMRTRSGSKLN